MSKIEKLFADAVGLATAFDENFIELAKVLRELQDEDTEEFNRAVEKSGVGSRKAYYLTGIDRAFSKIPVPKARLKKIGWTKLMNLAPHISKENYAVLLKQAETHTAKELEAILRGEEVAEKKKAILMYLSPADAELFEEVLMGFGARRSGRGMPNREEALMNAVRWIAEQKG